MKLLALTLSILTVQAAMAAPLTDIRGSWRDEPLYRYEPTAAEEEAERELVVQQLGKVRTMDSKELARLMEQHPEDKDARIFISLKGMNNSFIGLAAATSLGLIVFKQDDELMEVVQNNKSDFTESLADAGNHMGYITGIGPVVVGSYLLGVVMKNGKLKDIGIVAVGAGLATQLVTEGFKEVFGRRRPNVHMGANEFFVDEGKSFFSGHTSAAFSLATIISEVYGKDYPVVPYLAYGVAALTAYARMHGEKHWGSDVLVGAIAGHLITKIIYRIYTREQVPENERWFSIQPHFSPSTGYVGFEFDYVPKAWRPRVR